MDATVRATCPQCKTVLKIPAQWLGQAIKCKKCGSVVRTKAREGATETGHLDQTPSSGANPGAFDFSASTADEGDGSLDFGTASSRMVDDDGFDPTGGADISSQQPAPPPQPNYPYPTPPGYPPPGAYGAPPPGYPYAPHPGYPYAPPPGYPPGAAPPGYGAPPGAYGVPPPGYPYAPPPGYPPAPGSGAYGAPPGYPYPMPPGAAAPGMPPAPGMPGAMPGMPGAMPGMPPASGVYYGAGAPGAFPPAPAPGAPATPPAPRFTTPAAGVPATPPAPPAPASGVMSPRSGGVPAKPVSPTAKAPAVPGQTAKSPAATGQTAKRPQAPQQPTVNSAFKTDVPASSARAKKGNDKSKIIWVAVCLLLTGGLVTAAIMAAKSVNNNNVAKRLGDDPDKLVDYLGSPDATERDTALKLLRDMGTKAEQALKEGAKSSNADIAKKCQELLTSIKSDPKSGNPAHAKTGPFPRRLLFMHISKYMFLNPLTAGQAGGEDRTKGAAIRLANEWSVPFDPKDNERNQLFFLSDTARPDNLKTNDVQTPMKNVVEGVYTQFFSTSRAQDRIVVYFGGHALEIDGKPYLAPIEGDPDDVEPTMIPLSDFYDKMKACKATQRVVIWDVCRYNPQRGRQRPGSEPMSETLYKSLAAAPPGIEVIITCQPGENALEFFNLQIETGATATAAKYAGSAFLESMKYVASKNSKVVTKQAVPTDPLAMGEWSTQVGKRVADMATSPVVNLKQGLKLEGRGPANWVAYNPEEPLAKRFEFPQPPKGTNPAEVAAIVNEFNVPSIKLDLIDAGLGALPFRDEVMKDYKSDITADMVFKEKDTYKFQAKTLEAIDKIRKLWTVSPANDGPKMRDDFKAPVNDMLKNEIKKEQDFWAIGVAELELINAELDSLAADRDSQAKRWQAHYDYARATIKARLAFMNEYNKLMGNVLTETLPSLDAKLGQDTYKLTSVEKMKSSKDVQAIAKEAKEAYEKIVADHKGTPWAIQAKRDKSFAIGLAWQPISSGTGTTP